ncbi:MAG: ComF family protein [Anaerolineae bacterium]|nr:ComF family protein [Anaerolineae bacterium]
MPSLEINQEAPHTPAGLLLAIRQIGQWGLDLLFPPRCGNCGRVDIGWCDACTALLQATPIASHTTPLNNAFTVISSGIHADILREALHNLKYLRQTQLAPLLATRLTHLFAELDWRPDFITTVPMHPKKLAKRGYNQAGLIADAFADQVNLPYLPDALIRTKETISQVGLSAQERQENMRDVFNAHSNEIQGKIMLIVDDVLTTGATLSECAEALIDGGAQAVFGMTITHASDKQ